MSEVTFLFYLSLFLFFGLFFVSTFLQSVRRSRREARLNFQPAPGKKTPFYFRLQQRVLKETSVETVLFAASCVQHTLRVLYLLTFLAAYMEEFGTASLFFWKDTSVQDELWFLGFLAALTISLIAIADFIPRAWATFAPHKSLKVSTPIASFFLLIFSPFTFLLYKIMRLCMPKSSLSPFTEHQPQSKERLLDLIREIDESGLLNQHDKQLFQSCLNFRDRIAREVMVPRVQLFCLPETMTIRQAAHALQKEGYSRVPVYKNTQDHIVGMLMYKDVLAKYMECEDTKKESAFLEATIEQLIKPVLYSPETKKISLLLQEFRKKQMHLAVVVDEYGGTAGVVTIEDILEEIVGEIADEYDHEELLCVPLSRGGWRVDGRMNLLDLEEEIGIKIPQEGEYDTIAGYVFFRLGQIPKKGVILHHDDFELEILESGERFVEKVRITPLSQKDKSR